MREAFSGVGFVCDELAGEGLSAVKGDPGELNSVSIGLYNDHVGKCFQNERNATQHSDY